MDINEILSLIESVNIEQQREVWCPSLDKNIKILPLNASHQKDIIQSLIDNQQFNSSFNITLYQILKSILVNEDVDKLSILDKKFILLALRCSNISNTYNFEFIHKGKKTNKTLNLEQHLIEKSNIKNPEDVIKKINESYEVKIGIPTLKTEFEFDSIIDNSLKSLNKTDDFNVKNILSQIFIINILSYIKELKIKENVINFELLDVSEKLTIGATLPSKLINTIIKEIDNNYGKIINDVITSKVEIDKTSYNLRIKINNSFFLN